MPKTKIQRSKRQSEGRQINSLLALVNDEDVEDVDLGEADSDACSLSSFNDTHGILDTPAVAGTINPSVSESLIQHEQSSGPAPVKESLEKTNGSSSDSSSSDSSSSDNLESEDGSSAKSSHSIASVKVKPKKAAAKKIAQVHRKTFQAESWGICLLTPRFKQKNCLAFRCFVHVLNTMLTSDAPKNYLLVLPVERTFAVEC